MRDRDIIDRKLRLLAAVRRAVGLLILETIPSVPGISALPQHVIDALAQTAEGKGRDELLWPPQAGGHLAHHRPPTRGCQVWWPAARTGTSHSHG